MPEMEPRLITAEDKKLAGLCIKTTMAQNNTLQLWQQFMPRCKEIENRIGTALFSVQQYESNLDFNQFTPHTEFEKWAAAEVSSFTHLPHGIQPCLLPGGLYAVFIHKGTPQTFYRTAQYIFGTWLPASGYELDNFRPHFEIMGAQYKHNHPDSEEEVWIPVKTEQMQVFT